MDERLLLLTTRIYTFDTWPMKAFFNVWELAYCGFYFHGIGRNSDLLRCVFCGLVKGSWTIGDSPWLIHAMYSPECLNLLAKKGLDYLYNVYNTYPYLLTPQTSRGLPLIYSVSRGVVCDGLYGLIDRGLRITHTPYTYYLNDGTKYYPPANPAFINYYDRLETFQGYNVFGGIDGAQELAQSGQVCYGKTHAHFASTLVAFCYVFTNAM